MQQDIDTTEIEALCNSWGRWLRSGDSGQGAAQFRYDDPDNRGGGFSPGYCDPTAEVMDRLIARLSRPIKQALIARYYWQMSDRHAAIEIGISKIRFQMLATYGLQRLDAHIVAVTGRPVSAEHGLEHIDLFPCAL